MAKLLILRGLPASGKSTFAKAWVAYNTNRVRVNRDDLRTQLFGKPDYGHNQEVAVTTAEHSMVESLLQSGRDVVVDNCNLRKKYVRQFMEIAIKTGSEIEVKDFPISPEDAVKLDGLRGLRGERWVGFDVIQSMAKKFVKGDHTLPELPIVGSESYGRPYHGTPDGPYTILVDIDGTVAKGNGRSPYDYSKVGTDLPNHPVITVVQTLRDLAGWLVVFLSGRPETCREDTETWLQEHVGEFHGLFMRAAEDKRDDAIIKTELFDDHVRDDYDVVCVFDDRNRVVRSWRSMGLTCLQVEDGAF